MTDFKKFHQAAAEREIGLALAREAQRSQTLRTDIHHEESYIAEQLPRKEDLANERLVEDKLTEYLVRHEEKIRTAVRDVLERDDFTADRPVIIRLSTAIGDLPRNEKVREEIAASSLNMMRSIVTDDEDEVLYEELPIEAYCFKRYETGSTRGTFSAYIVRLVNANESTDTMIKSFHPNITDLKLISLLDNARIAERVVGDSARFIMKVAEFELPASTSRLKNYEFTDPSAEAIRAGSIVSGRESVEKFIDKWRVSMTPKEIQWLSI